MQRHGIVQGTIVRRRAAMVMTVLADNLPGVGDALLIWESLISRKIPHHSATMQKPKLRLDVS
jgi:hypothetical protein